MTMPPAKHLIRQRRLGGKGYPGGPLICYGFSGEKPGRFNFPRPMIDKNSFDMSFSGFKNPYARNLIESQSPLSEQDKADISKAFEEAVVDTLLIKRRKL
ncbi:MAG: hypothetical protein Ct9H90mP27_5670 [Gammaproteobacteria bacterium]|nr:MAG: hypothetical protein Ct9H90mP27_5670 [Gammaproteobacteria bacterium]